MSTGDMRKFIDMVNGKRPLTEARYHTVLNDAVSALTRAMDGEDTEEFDYNVQRAMLIFRQADASSIHKKWMMYVADLIIAQLYAMTHDMAGKELSKKLDRIVIKKKEKNADFAYLGTSTAQHLENTIKTLEHFAGIDYNPIKNLNVESTKEEGFIKTLKRLEQEFIEASEASKKKIKPMDGDKVIIKFDDGFAWVLLDRESCSIEGKAMGHCGNAGSPEHGDRILSLRKISNDNGEVIHEPSLTFIVNNKTLGEMKGRANNKPHKKYHPYIIELLKSEYVTNIKGGGYKPENNFNLLDLTKEQFEEVTPHLKLDDNLLDAMSILIGYENKNQRELLEIIEYDIAGRFDIARDFKLHLKSVYQRVIIEEIPKGTDEVKYYHYLADNGIKNKNMMQVYVIERVPVRLLTVAQYVLGERWPEVEHIIATDTHAGISYTRHLVKGRWEEFEESLVNMKAPPDKIIEYVTAATNNSTITVDNKWRSPAFEKILLKDGSLNHLIRYYRMLEIDGRWPEFEEKLFKETDNDYFVVYMQRVIDDENPELWEVILKSKIVRLILWYSRRYMERPDSDIEDVILEKGTPSQATAYVIAVAKRRVPKLEKMIAKDGDGAFDYARRFIDGRWPEGEENQFGLSELRASDYSYFAASAIKYLGLVDSPNDDLTAMVKRVNDPSLTSAYKQKFGEVV